MTLEELRDLANDAGPLVRDACERYEGEPENAPSQVKIRALVNKHFSALTRTLTPDHLSILMHLEGCDFCQPANLVTHVHDRIERVDKESGKMVRQEFQTRISYLMSHGLISLAEDKTRVCLSHLGKGSLRVLRDDGRLPASATTRKEKAFIGSSGNGLPLAYALQNHLAPELRCVVWDKGGVFGLGEFTMESLEKAARDYDYGIFVFTPDDLLVKKGEELAAPRDNVIFELGLFIGRMSRSRAFLVNPSGGSLPTDLAGLTTATYNLAELSDDLGDTDEEVLNYVVGPVAGRILSAVKRVRRESRIDKCA